MSGPVRFAFYLLLFAAIFTHVGDPLLAPEVIRVKAAILYMPVGVAGLVHAWPNPRWLLAVRLLTVGAWLCASIGLFWRASSIATAVGFFVLAGAWACYDFYRGPLLPLYALTFLCISSCDDRWTLDTHIARRWPRYWFRPSPPGSVARTGFARTLVAVATASVYFTAGMTKMLDGGPRWADGATILHEVGKGCEDWPGASWICDRMLKHPSLCTLGAILTLAVELGAPTALLSRRLRHVWVALATCLQIGILYLIGPNFLAWTATYLVLLVDWGRLRTHEGAAEPAVVPARWPIAVGLSTVAVFTTVLVLQRDFWPFSYMLMFSSYDTAHSLGGVPSEAFGDATTAHELATRCVGGAYLGNWGGGCRYAWGGAFGSRAGFRLAGEPSCTIRIDPRKDLTDHHEPSNVVDGARHGQTEHGTWMQALKLATIQGIAAKPSARLDEPLAPDALASRFVRDLVPLVAPMTAGHPECTRLEMTYRLNSGPVVITSAPLAQAPGALPPRQWYSGLPQPGSAEP
jgi:hypothetical protein